MTEAVGKAAEQEAACGAADADGADQQQRGRLRDAVVERI